MILNGTGMLPQPDGHHLTKSAFDVPIEIRVGLDSVHHHNVVGFQRIVIEKHRNTLGCFANLSGFHRRPHRRAHTGFRDSVVLQHRSLPLGSPTSMTAHGRDDEWADTEFSKLIHNRTNNDRDISHTATTASNRHGLPGFQPARQAKLANLL